MKSISNTARPLVGPPSGPVFICGHPRSGTTALYNQMYQHPEFKNELYHDKEFKFFRTLIQERPWGRNPNLSDYRLAENRPLDDLYLKEMIKLTHKFLRKHASGKNGRYLNAYPYDSHHIDYIFAGDKTSRFLILLREPYSNVWSMLNYRGGKSDWARKSSPKEGVFHKEDIWNCAKDWAITIWSVARIMQTEAAKACLIVRHEQMLLQPSDIYERICTFVGIQRNYPPDSFESTMIHSSFSPESAEGVEPMLRSEMQRRRSDASENIDVAEACEYFLKNTLEPRRAIGLLYDHET